MPEEAVRVWAVIASRAAPIASTKAPRLLAATLRNSALTLAKASSTDQLLDPFAFVGTQVVHNHHLP